MEKITVSIITVVYNGAKTLEQTINSVINQTYKNIEYIIVDGGSKDESLNIIKKHEKDISKWVSEKDNGLYDAMNKGISMASGELIGMINSDDWYETNAVELVVNSYIKYSSKKIFHGDRFNILENGEKQLRNYNPSKVKLIYYGMTFNHPSMFVHREIYKNIKYNDQLKSLSDYQFVLTNFISNPNIFHYIPKSYVNYRLDGISSRLNLRDSIREGYIARRNSRLNLTSCYISTIIRILAYFIYQPYYKYKQNQVSR